VPSPLQSSGECFIFFPLSELAALLFQDDYEYGSDEQEYLIATHTGFTRKEIISLTRAERIKLFERIKLDVENDTEYKKQLLEFTARAAGYSG